MSSFFEIIWQQQNLNCLEITGTLAYSLLREKCSLPIFCWPTVCVPRLSVFVHGLRPNRRIYFGHCVEKTCFYRRLDKVRDGSTNSGHGVFPWPEVLFDWTIAGTLDCWETNWKTEGMMIFKDEGTFVDKSAFADPESHENRLNLQLLQHH